MPSRSTQASSNGHKRRERQRKRARDEGRRILEESVVRLGDKAVGTQASLHPQGLNYDQCFVRDFIPGGLHFLFQGETDIVKNFLCTLSRLQGAEREKNPKRLGAGLMPHSFQPEPGDGAVMVDPDYGEEAIGRVVPIDSCLWWIWLLGVYTRCTGDDLASSPDIQEALKRALEVFLQQRFEFFPTLLVPDGAFMVDRRLGVHGHPLEVQTLFFAALRFARELLIPNQEEDYCGQVELRLHHLSSHLHDAYWLDIERINTIYRYSTDQYGDDAVNRFNVRPDNIPEWVVEWLADGSGYFASNVGTSQLDFRFFSQGNLIAILGGLAGGRCATSIMKLLELRQDDLIGRMPMKLCYPAVSGRDWELLTGSDPKNMPWSYHNGGHWPVLLWPLVAAALATGREDIALASVEKAACRLPDDRWPEYYDGVRGRLVGKAARLEQVWSATGYLVAEDLLADPSRLELFTHKTWEVEDVPSKPVGTPVRLSSD